MNRPTSERVDLTATSSTGCKILVTGSAGFIGAHVVAAIAERGIESIGLIRPGGVARGKGHTSPSVEADYHDAEATKSALRAVAPDVLVHAAWRLAEGSRYLADPTNIAELRASLRLFELAHEVGCRRIVGIGTCLEYAPSDQPTAENAPLGPRSVYASSKAALGIAAGAWAATVGLGLAWVRLYHPFGPGEAAGRLVPTVVTALLRGEPVKTTSGEQRRSFLYVDDAAEAIATLALSDVEGAFNVGSAEAVSVREFVERTADVVGRRDLLEIGALEPRPDDPKVLWADTGRLTSLTSWRPTVKLDEAIERTVDWWRARPPAGRPDEPMTSSRRDNPPARPSQEPLPG